MATSLPKKRLALICQHFYPEMISTGIFITQLATGLARMGWAVRVYCGQPVYQAGVDQSAPSPLREVYQGVEIVRVPAWGNGRGALWLRALNALTFLFFVGWRLLCDHCELYGVVNTTNPPILGLVACLIQWLVGLPFVTIVHDVYPDVAIRLGALSPNSLVARIWARLTRLILAHSAGIVVIGRDMEQLIRSKLKTPTDKVTLIPHWSDVDQARPSAQAIDRFVRQHSLQNKLVIQYAGRMGRLHNLEVLLEAAQRLQTEPVIFQFIGDGAKRAALVALAQNLRLTNVQFLPYQPYAELAPALAAADLAVVCLEANCTGVSVPSKTYGIMASGRPLLALLDPPSEIGQMVQETACGIVLPKATGAQVATVIRELLTDPARLAAMGERGYRVFQQTYTQAQAIRRYADFFQQRFSLEQTHPIAPSRVYFSRPPLQ